MKLVMLAALEDDIEAVHRLLRERGVTAYSELPVEGHGLGSPGWYGDTPAYRSSMVLTFLPTEVAEGLLAAIDQCIGCKDPRHPVRAWMLDVERAVVPFHPETNPSKGGAP